MPESVDSVTKVVARIADDPTPRTFVGRYAWTLAHLVEAGGKGLTSYERPAPRWSHYVHILRSQVEISTEMEAHPGPFPGAHARYRLETPVTILSVEHGKPARRKAA